jgi:hypothetical protein
LGHSSARIRARPKELVQQGLQLYRCGKPCYTRETTRTREQAKQAK